MLSISTHIGTLPQPLLYKKVFVYGTLKEGYNNHHLLDGAILLDKSKIIDGYKLYYSYNDRGFPVASLSEDDSVIGELYQLPENSEYIIARLDHLESEGFAYRRVEIEPNTYMYVGMDSLWKFNTMKECPKNDKGFFSWNI